MATGLERLALRDPSSDISANDECDGAILVGLGTTEYDNTFARTQSIDPCPSIFGSGGKELSFAFTAPATGEYLITSLGEITSSPSGLMEYPTFIVLDSCETFPIACVNTGFGTVGFRIDLIGGQMCTIQVGGLGNFDSPPLSAVLSGCRRVHDHADRAPGQRCLQQRDRLGRRRVRV